MTDEEYETSKKKLIETKTTREILTNEAMERGIASGIITREEAFPKEK